MSTIRKKCDFDQRGIPRHYCDINGVIETSSGFLNCRFQNVSTVGLAASIGTVVSLSVGQTVSVLKTALGEVHGVVIWRNGEEVGIMFNHPVEDSKVSAFILEGTLLEVGSLR